MNKEIWPSTLEGAWVKTYGVTLQEFFALLKKADKLPDKPLSELLAASKPIQAPQAA